MIEHRYAEVNGIRLHYAEAGEGKLLLFLHGFPEFWYEWKDQLAEFGRDYHAVAPDMRGYNLSEKPEGLDQYGIEHLVEDVRALIDQLGGKPCVLVAHDWGGAVAWAFALRHPDYLEKLIIVNMAHPACFGREMAGNPEQQRASQYMLMFRSAEAEAILSAEGNAALVNAVLAGGLASGRFTEADKAEYLAAWSQPGALTGGLNYYRAAAIGPPSEAGEARGNFAIDPDALVVRVPTLVIWGEQDTALLACNLDGLEEYVPDLTVRRIPEGSHWVVHEEPELVNRYMREFIEG